jgi:aminoglycoside phosphotransferase (APT) family kinase protein
LKKRSANKNNGARVDARTLLGCLLARFIVHVRTRALADVRTFVMKGLCARALEEAGLGPVRSLEVLTSHTLNQVFLVRDGNDRRLVVRVARPGAPHVFWGDSKAKYRAEEAAMRFARASLAAWVHVPQVVAAGVDAVEGLPYLVMECVDGVPLRVALKSGLAEREATARRLMELVARMCSLPPPVPHIGSLGDEGRGLFFDGPELGACVDVQEFASRLLNWSARHCDENGEDSTLCAMLRRAESELRMAPGRLVFRHGDLSIDNVMVLSDNGGLALIDWEFAGVYDERDVWLEARELMTALGQEALWRELQPMDSAELDRFERCKEVMMGVSWAAAAKTSADRQEELQVLHENLTDLFK